MFLIKCETLVINTNSPTNTINDDHRAAMKDKICLILFYKSFFRNLLNLTIP